VVVKPYKVYIVVDREFGERLSGLDPDVPVWVISSPANRAVAERLLKNYHHENHLTGITTFKDSESASTEDLLVSELDTIELHHGFHSANPPYTVLEIFGTPLSERIKAELSRYGFNEFRPQSEGFNAGRPIPSN
jgi:hypothetical protein